MNYPTYTYIKPDVSRQLFHLVQTQFDRSFTFGRCRRGILKMPQQRSEVDPYAVVGEDGMDDSKISEDITRL